MLFHQLPTFVLALMMIISCAVKHIGIRRLVRKAFYLRLLNGRHWYWATLAVTLISGLSILLIFINFVPRNEAVTFALLDAGAHLLTMLYARSAGVFAGKMENSNPHLILINSLHGLLYLVYIDTALR